MDMQYFLKILWDKLDVWYRKREKISDPEFTWRRDHWILLSVRIDEFIEAKPLAIENIKETLYAKNRKKNSKNDIVLSVSDSTLERIYKTVHDKAYLPEDYYDVTDPSSSKRTTLDILSALVGRENWNDFTFNEFDEVLYSKDYVGAMVVNSIKAEFWTLQQLPKCDTSRIDLYLMKNGTYYKHLIAKLNYKDLYQEHILKVKGKVFDISYTLDEYVINNLGNQSLVEYKDVKVEFFTKKKAIISTYEKWIIYKYIPKLNMEILSNDTAHNYYLYILYNNGKDWKIEGKYLSVHSYKQILQGIPKNELQSEFHKQIIDSGYVLTFD
jgi:hypothetical protein